nr:hypothetical protein [uncultured Flavobacterium sp.]
MARKIFIGLIISIFLFVAYNSKRNYYEMSRDFHSKYFNGEIQKIEEGRGIEIYYEKDNFFYKDDYEGPELFVGDILRKSNHEITIMRQNSSGDYIEVGKGKSIEPKKSYFDYFFGI